MLCSPNPFDDTLGKLRLGIDEPNRRVIQEVFHTQLSVFAYFIEVSFDIGADDESVEIVEILFAEIYVR